MTTRTQAFSVLPIEVERVFAAYPEKVRHCLMVLREVILDVAKEDGIECLEETLKWGEPSYLSPHGSTIRFDWKPKTPKSIFCISIVKLV